MEPERLERFWAKVDVAGENECWLWTASVNSKGYGSFTIEPKKSASAHKISWALAYNDGILPDAKGHVMHACDVRNCVNPKHLSYGTPKDNALDALNKGRLYIKKHSEDPYCRNGHPRTVENTHPKYKTCILCKRESDKDSKRREREKNREAYNKYHREYYQRARDVKDV